jgi:hypothetical protein
MVTAKRLTGINPLSYMGVEPYTPVPLFVRAVAPTANDAQNFNIGTIWLVTGNSVPEEVWMLVALVAGIATWVQLYPGSGGGGASQFPCNVGTANEAGGILNILGDGTFITTTGVGNTVTITLNNDFTTTYDTDSGTATPAGGVLHVHGGSNINTSGAGNTVTISLDDNVTIPGTLTVDGTTVLATNVVIGGTVQIIPFAAGVVQSDATGHLFSNKGTDGQILIGSGAGAPAWANITSMDGSVIVTDGANTIDLSAPGGGGGTNCAFLAHQAASVGAFTASALYTLGTDLALVVDFDVGSNFYPGNGAGSPARFTAPKTAKYYLQLNVKVSNSPFSSATTTALARIVTPARSYDSQPVLFIPGSTGDMEAPLSVCADLTAGDVVTFIAGVQSALGAPGGTVRGAANPVITYCSGFLVGSGSAGNASITTTFTSSGTWMRNAATQTLEVIGWSGGGGGSAGSSNNGSAAGGGGGGNVGLFWVSGPAAYFPAATTITIGAGGAGGASTTGGGLTPIGANGGATSFGTLYVPEADAQITNPSVSHTGGGRRDGTFSSEQGDLGDFLTNSMFIESPNWQGYKGSGGNGAGGIAVIGYNGVSGAFADRGLVRASGTNFWSGTTGFAMAGTGGGGAGINALSLGTAYSGGSGVAKTLNASGSLVPGGAGGIETGTIDGGNGSPGVTTVGIVVGGTAGGGGGNQAVGGRGGNGGNGGFPGGGGGGGGASHLGSPSGSGGNGANGQLIIIEYL